VCVRVGAAPKRRFLDAPPNIPPTGEERGSHDNGGDISGGSHAGELLSHELSGKARVSLSLSVPLPPRRARFYGLFAAAQRSGGTATAFWRTLCALSPPLEPRTRFFIESTADKIKDKIIDRHESSRFSKIEKPVSAKIHENS